MGVLRGLLVFMGNLAVKRKRRPGNYYVSYSTAAIFLGCVVGILMRSCLIVKRKGGHQELKIVC